MRRFLLIPKLEILNANALNSPYTIGFPAITAWLGAVHALERALGTEEFPELRFTGVAVSCHKVNIGTYRGPGDYVRSIVGTANPLDKKGERPPFVEEAKCHVSVSILVEVQGFNNDLRGNLEQAISSHLHLMKWAGGDLLRVDPLEILAVDEDDANSVRTLLRRLMLGHVIVERRDLVAKAMQEEGLDALDAVLSYLKIMHRSGYDEVGNVHWRAAKKAPGWLVPIPVGFQGISDLGYASNQRDAATPHRFAESIVSLGEFVMPFRIENIDTILWQYNYDEKNNLYLCQTKESLKGD